MTKRSGTGHQLIPFKSYLKFIEIQEMTPTVIVKNWFYSNLKLRYNYYYVMPKRI